LQRRTDVLLKLQFRCGSHKWARQFRIQALPLADLETLTEALLDFQGPDTTSTPG
jgi:hypothetical protein